MTSRICLLTLSILLPPVWAAQDPGALIHRLIEAQQQNDRAAQQYTYVEDTERITFDQEGEPHVAGTSTHEVIFVEGLKYDKLVARNGKPLSKREQAKVEKDMRLTAEERRRNQHPLAPGGVVVLHGLFTNQTLDLGSFSELLTLFDNRLAGEEQMRGHKTWVIESTPQADYVPFSEHEKQVRIFRKKFWVDQAEGVLVRAIYTVAAEDSFLRPGSSLDFEYEKIDANTWEPVSLTLEFSRARETREKTFRPTGQTIYRMSKFQKFDVQSTITIMDPGK